MLGGEGKERGIYSGTGIKVCVGGVWGVWGV